MVDAEHGSVIAAAWAGVTAQTVTGHRKQAGQRRRPTGDQRGRPSLHELARRAPRPDCPCPRCVAHYLAETEAAARALHSRLTVEHHAVRLTALPVIEPLDGWRADAACRGVATIVMFPTGTPGRNHDIWDPAAEAKALCASCPVTDECLAYADDHGIAYGVWGGLDENQRLNIRRARRRGTAP